MKVRIAVRAIVALASLLQAATIIAQTSASNPGPSNLFTSAITPQEPPKLPPFNVPVVCADGKTYVVLECRIRGRMELCTFRELKIGVETTRGYTTRAQLSARLQSCRPIETSQRTSARALNPAYLSEMPAVERVKAEIKGTDAMDTAARQMGAFWQLQQIIKELSGLRFVRNELTPDEKRLLGEYSGGYQSASQPYASYPDKPKWYKMHSFYEVDDGFRDELFKRFVSPDLRAQYFKVKEATRTTVQARREAREQAAKDEQARAQAESQEYMTQQQNKFQKQRALARCIASGRSETQCFVEALGKDFVAMNPILSNTPAPSGLALTGAYSGPGGFSVWFYPETAIVGCSQVKAEAGYAIEMKDNQVRVKLVPSKRVGLLKFNENVMKLLPQSSNPDEWQGQRIAFSLRPDGKIAGSGTIKVTGPVAVGETKQQTTEQKRIQASEASGYNRLDVHRDGLGLYVEERVTRNVPVYESRTAGCTLGAMSPTGPSPVAGSVSTLTATALNLAFGGEDKAAGKMPPPGVRMNGKYVGQSGFDLEFLPESAVVACREVVVARDYSVSINGNRVLVNIQNSAKPIELELRPDGTLAGSGPVQVNGRVLMGVNANNEPVFQSATDTCALGVLTSDQPTSGTGGIQATAQPTTSATPPKPNNPSTAASATISGGTAVLSFVSGFATQPGVNNPLAVKTFYLLKDSLESVLTKSGVRLQPGMSAFKSWLFACSNRAPECQQGQTAIDANSATVLKTDPSGKAQFPPIPPGSYYLMGITRYDNQLLLWNLRVDLKPGVNSVTLDQRNALPIN